MTEATFLTTMLALFGTSPNMGEVEGLWRNHRVQIDAMSPDDKDALVAAGAKARAHFDAMPSEADDTWVADFMEGRI